MKLSDDYINKVICGDCVEVMGEMPENSIDAIVTDPPYGLEFMRKEWDRFGGRPMGDGYKGNGGIKRFFKGNKPIYSWNMIAFYEFNLQWLKEAYRVLKPGGSMLAMGGTRTFHRLMVAIEDTGFIIKDTLMWLYGSGFPKAQDLGKMIDKRGRKIKYGLNKLQDKLNKKRIEKKLTLKDINRLFGVPGNSGCAAHKFCDKSQPQFPTREQMKILDDVLKLKGELWELYDEIEREIIGKKQAGLGTGSTYAFTENNIKAQKEIDVTAPATDLAKYWNGWKIGGIKPAYEPIVWAVKPPEGSYIDNVLKWGVGAVNVDATRINYQNNETPESVNKSSGISGGMFGTGKSSHIETKGRFPANIILSHHPECKQIGVKRDIRSGGFGKGNRPWVKGKISKNTQYIEIEIGRWQCHSDCAVRLLDEQSGERMHSAGKIRKAGTSKQNNPNSLFLGDKGSPNNGMRFGDSGGASRFFYCAKASKSERGENNKHPTVKPIKLFEWLIKLITREEQIVLDPFIGSGTTAIASFRVGRKYIGIEREKEYIKIAEERLAQGILKNDEAE